MPSTSKSQQRLMGVAYAVKSGDMQLSDVDNAYRDKVEELVNGMTLKDLKDFASTPHEDLPEEVKESYVNEALKMLIDPLMHKIMKQFGFSRDPQIKAELREEIKAAVAAVLVKHDIIVEANDHEVGMALGQLESIINAAMDLEEKIGTEEKDLPGWIQDHISQSYNYIKQANDNYHELKNENLSAVTPAMLGGMGDVSLPNGDAIGSGDVPAGPGKAKKRKKLMSVEDFIQEQKQIKPFEPEQGEGEALGEGEYEKGSANDPDQEMAQQAARHRAAANVITFSQFANRI